MLKHKLILTVFVSLAAAIPFVVNAQTPRPYSELYIVSASPDGRMVAGVERNGLIRVWDAQIDTVLFDLAKDDTTPPPLSLAWSPDSQRIAAAGGDPIIRVWCADNSPGSRCTPGQLVAELKGHEDPITAIAWSKDNRLASGGQLEVYSLRTWDMNTYLPLGKDSVGSVSQLAWHPTSNLIAEVSDAGGAYIVDGDLPNAPDRPRSRLSPNDLVSTLSVAWNSNGSQLAYGTYDGEIYIVDPVTKTSITTLQGHTAPVYALAWNPDDVRLASSSSDGTLRIWNLVTHEVQVIPADKNLAATLQISWSLDGSRLYYANESDTPAIWRTPSSAEVTPAP